MRPPPRSPAQLWFRGAVGIVFGGLKTSALGDTGGGRAEAASLRRKIPGRSLATPKSFPAGIDVVNRDRFDCRQRPVHQPRRGTSPGLTTDPRYLKGSASQRRGPRMVGRPAAPNQQAAGQVESSKLAPLWGFLR